MSFRMEEEEQIVFPVEGMRLEDARVAIDKKSKALDRIVEVVSGNAPHASSAPTTRIIAYWMNVVNGVLRLFRRERSRK